jgi:hypothetical protein
LSFWYRWDQVSFHLYFCTFGRRKMADQNAKIRRCHYYCCCTKWILSIRKTSLENSMVITAIPTMAAATWLRSSLSLSPRITSTSTGSTMRCYVRNNITPTVSIRSGITGMSTKKSLSSSLLRYYSGSCRSSNAATSRSNDTDAAMSNESNNSKIRNIGISAHIDR